MQPSGGRAFGPYQIIEPLGAGGMGEVFKARDSRLNRLVALKTSKEQFTDRFAGEARATAAINHPNVATLYDVGPDYLVMEYVEGVTLKGPLPVPRAVQYAREILAALDAAHRKGIVHRDLKPANILVSKAGVKLLDFGLAQMKEIAPAGDGTATMAISVAGSIAGTLQYMAPEQLQGKPADARSDIFAFGLVLYEMLTGRPAFEADNAASLISAIMTSEAPVLHDRLPSAPPALERIFQVCVAKDPDDRWQSAADIQRALDLVDMPAATVAPAPEQRNRKANWRLVAAGLLILGAGIAAGMMVRGAKGKPVAPSWTFRPLTYSGRAYKPSLSPDGKQVAFVWAPDNSNQFDLHVQLVGGGNPLRLKDTQPVGRPAWSPDGSQIAYQRRDGLYVIAALGGASRRVASLRDLVSSPNVAWAPGGSYFIIDGRKGALQIIASDGGEPRDLTSPQNASDDNPSIAPDGSAVAFVRRTSTFNSMLMVLTLDKDGGAKGEPRSIATSSSFIRSLDWLSDGSAIIYENAPGGGNAALWRIDKDGGEPSRVNVPSMVAGEPATARQGGRLVFVSGFYETKIFKASLADPKQAMPIVEALGDHRDIGVSRDGSRIVFVSTRTGSKEVWTANADGSNQTQLTSFDSASVGSPRFSPDGTQIAFDGYASGSSDIYVVSVDGGKPVHLTKDPANEIRPSWSSDGKWIYFGWNRGGSQQIWKIPAGGGDPVQVSRNGGQEAFETLDGQWLYVAQPPNLYRLKPDGSEESKVREGVYPSMFALGERNLYVLDSRGSSLFRAPIGSSSFALAAEFTDANRPTCLGPCLGIPADESFVTYRRNTRTSTTLTLIDNFQ